jgi:hypothetical protein
MRVRHAAVVVLLAGSLIGVAHDAPASGSATKSLCRGTKPNHTVPQGAGFSRAGFNYGGQYLRAHLNWETGTLRAGILPDGGAAATIQSDGSIWVKQGWWRGLSARLVITGRRLDAPSPPLRASVPSGYGDSGFIATGLTFPSAGCWRVSGVLGSARLSYVVRIVKLPGQ